MSSRTDNKGNNKGKYISKPKFSREKTYACEENDIIKNEQKFNIQKEERDKIRHHNLRVASGEIDNSMEAVNSKNEDEDNNSSKKKKNKKIAEKKAPEANNVVVTNHSTIPDSDSDNDNDNN